MNGRNLPCCASEYVILKHLWELDWASIHLAQNFLVFCVLFVVCSRYISIYLSIFQFENRIYRILPRFALSIYLRAQIHQKVIQCFVELGQIDQIVAYVGNPSWQLRWCCVARCWVVGFQGKRMEMGLLNRFDPVEEIMLVVAMVRKKNLRSSVLKCCWCGQAITNIWQIRTECPTPEHL